MSQSILYQNARGFARTNIMRELRSVIRRERALQTIPFRQWPDEIVARVPAIVRAALREEALAFPDITADAIEELAPRLEAELRPFVTNTFIEFTR